MRKASKLQRGFTLIELMVTIAIVGILATLAIPSLQDYTRRARYAEVVSATAPFKIAITECFNTMTDGTAAQLNANCAAGGKNAIPPNFIGGTGLVASVVVGNQASITVTPNTKRGILNTDIYILTPKVVTPATGQAYLLWSASGLGVEKGYAKENP